VARLYKLNRAGRVYWTCCPNAGARVVPNSQRVTLHRNESKYQRSRDFGAAAVWDKRAPLRGTVLGNSPYS